MNYSLVFISIILFSVSSFARRCPKVTFPAIKLQMICMYGQNLGSCGILGDRFSQSTSFKDSIKSANLYYRHSNQSVVGNVVSKEIQQQVLDTVEDEILDTAIYQTLRQMGLRYTGKAGASALVALNIGRVILRRVSLITSVGSILLVPDQTMGCSEIRDRYINRAKGYCKPDYNFNENVLKFLMKKSKARAKIMSNTHGVCEYYQEFEKTLKKESKGIRQAVSLKCDSKGKGFELVTQERGAWLFKGKREYFVSFKGRGRKKHVDSVSLTNWRGKKYLKYKFNRRGMVKNYKAIRTDAEEINLYKETKMEIFSAQNCCREVLMGRKRCLRNY